MVLSWARPACSCRQPNLCQAPCLARRARAPGPQLGSGPAPTADVALERSLPAQCAACQPTASSGFSTRPYPTLPYAGVADGVGSWADYPIPVDAGIYARLLMTHAKAAAAGLAPSALAPLTVMRAAHSKTLVQVRARIW